MGARPILRPPGNEAPADQRQLATRFLGMLPDDGNRLSWGDIVARAPVFFARHDVEVLFDNLFPAR
jgi:hypothetical protein